MRSREASTSLPWPDAGLRRVEVLLTGHRLLDAAGACELLSECFGPAEQPLDSSESWRALASAVRAYRAAIFGTTLRGFAAIEDWARIDALSRAVPELREESERLLLEYEHWMAVVPAGRAYIAWLAAYVATIEMDGARAVVALRQWASTAREFVDVPDLEGLSVYELLQASADSLTTFLPLPVHPVRDVRRFAFLPAPLPTANAT